MCGRFTQRKPASDVAKAFELIEVPELFPRYNVAPTQDVPVVRLGEGEPMGPMEARWRADRIVHHHHDRTERVDAAPPRPHAGHPAAEVYDLWLDPAVQEPERLQPLLCLYPAEEMEAYPVSTLVNKPQNGEAECIARIS